MIHASTYIVSDRMFDVMIKHPDNLNVSMTRIFRKSDPYYYDKLRKDFGLETNQPIEFFTAQKMYPALGNMHKGTIVEVRAQKSKLIPLPSKERPHYEYTEENFIMVPDNFGYLRYIGIYDVIVVQYEHPRVSQRKQCDLVKIDYGPIEHDKLESWDPPEPRK